MITSRIVPLEIAHQVTVADAGPLAVMRCTAISGRPLRFDLFSFCLPPRSNSPPFIVEGKLMDMSGAGTQPLLALNPGLSVEADRPYVTAPYYAVFADAGYMRGLVEEIYDRGRIQFEPRAYPAWRGLCPDVYRLMEESGGRSPEIRVAMESLAVLVAVGLLRSALPERTAFGGNEKRHPGVRRACRLIREGYETSLGIRDLAAAACLSPSHFIVRFKKETGCTPHEYLRKVRIEAAMRLLREGSDVTRACFAVGFTSMSGFEEAFRRQTGIRPMEYRASVRA